MEELHFPNLLFVDLPELVDVGVGSEMWISSSDVAVSTSPVAMIAIASQAAPTSKDVAARSEDLSTAEVSTSTSGHECRPVGTQTAVHVSEGFAALSPPGGLTFVQLVDEVRLHPHWTIPQIVYRLASGYCAPPLQGPDFDTLNLMVTVAALYEFRFIEDFSGRAEAAPILPETGGQRNYEPLHRQLTEQAERSLPDKVRMVNPVEDAETVRSMSEPEVMSDDEEGFDDDPFY